MCPLTVLSVSQSLLCAVFMADLNFTVGVEFARKLDAAFMADTVVVPLVACSPEWSLPVSD